MASAIIIIKTKNKILPFVMCDLGRKSGRHPSIYTKYGHFRFTKSPFFVYSKTFRNLGEPLEWYRYYHSLVVSSISQYPWCNAWDNESGPKVSLIAYELSIQGVHCNYIIHPGFLALSSHTRMRNKLIIFYSERIMNCLHYRYGIDFVNFYIVFRQVVSV